MTKILSHDQDLSTARPIGELGSCFSLAAVLSVRAAR